MVCAGVMLACALICSNLGTRWDAWASGPQVYATLQQGACTSGFQTRHIAWLRAAVGDAKRIACLSAVPRLLSHTNAGPLSCI